MKSVFQLTCLATLCLICRSIDATEPVVVVAPHAMVNPRQPQVAIDHEKRIFVTFGSSESIFICKSDDVGKTYQAPVKIGQLTKLALGRRRGPRIATTRHSVVVAAISHETGNLMAWRSTDGGMTWGAPMAINDSPASAREGLHALASGPGELLFCVWLDLRDKGTKIFGCKSEDGGASWEKNRLVYASPSGTVCECCHPSVAIDHDGQIYVMWRNSLDGNRDMYLATSDDGGTTFGPAKQLGSGNWKLNACPMDGGDLAVSADGKVTTVWRRDRRLFTATPDNRFEHPLAAGEQPWAAATSAGEYLVWLSRRGSALWLLTPNGESPTQLADVAADPVVAVSGSGTGPIIAAWESGDGPNTSIMATVLSQ